RPSGTTLHRLLPASSPTWAALTAWSDCVAGQGRAPQSPAWQAARRHGRLRDRSLAAALAAPGGPVFRILRRRRARAPGGPGGEPLAGVVGGGGAHQRADR